MTMRGLNEQLREIPGRSRIWKREKQRRRARLVGAGAVSLCLVLIAGVSLWISGLSVQTVSMTATPYGSLLAGGQYVGYIVVGFLAFLLGVLVTLLGLEMRKRKEREKERDSR